jgi:hypothetical protein
VSGALDLAGLVSTEGFETLLIAPCGCSDIHLVGVDVLQGDHVIEIRRTTTQQPAQNQGRGSVAVLRFWDENGHTFDVGWRFHKGQVYVQRSECRPCEEPPSTLWRD